MTADNRGCLVDGAWIVGTICVLDLIELTFGRAVEMAVGITAIIGIVIFLWHVGASQEEGK
jgi:hypothetical protein